MGNIKQQPVYKQLSEALRLMGKQAVSEKLKSNLGVKSFFYRNHDCQYTLDHALERRHFDFDTAYGLLHLLGYRPQCVETVDGHALLLLPIGSYDSRMPLEIAKQESRVYLARLLEVDDSLDSVAKVLNTFAKDRDFYRDASLTKEKFILEFKAHATAH